MQDECHLWGLSYTWKNTTWNDMEFRLWTHMGNLFCRMNSFTVFWDLYLSYSSTLMWHLLDNLDSTLVKSTVWCHPVNAWKWRCMSPLVYQSRLAVWFTAQWTFLLCDPSVCLSLWANNLSPETTWNRLDFLECHVAVMTLGFGCRRGEALFYDFWLLPYPLFPVKALWFLAFAYMPRLYSVPVVPFVSLPIEASTVVIFVFLSKKKKWGA